MIVCVPVTPDEAIDPRWGRAGRVAVAEVRGGDIDRFEIFEVGWDALHDGGSEGSHHARVARFIQTHGVEVVVANHMGEPMVRMLEQMGVDVRLGAGGAARRAILDAAETRA